MTRYFKHELTVSPGDPVSAQRWNELARSAARHYEPAIGEVGKDHVIIRAPVNGPVLRGTGDGDGGGGGGGIVREITIDVLVCDPWNRCGQYIVFPQKRIHLPAWCRIEDIEPTVVPIYECQSTGSGGSGGSWGSGGSGGSGGSWGSGGSGSNWQPPLP
jgi:hypothetical protein